MSSVQIRPPRFISPSRKVRTLRLGLFIGACDPRVRASRFIPRHSLLPASQSTCGHSLATQSAPSVAPKVVKSGRPDSFRPVVKPSRKVRTLRLGFFNLSATHALRQANFPPSQAAGRYAAPRSKMMNHVGAGIKKAIVIPPIMWTTPITTAKIIL